MQTLYMQARIARRAASTWGVSMGHAARRLDEAGAFGYISENYGLLHHMGDAAVFADVESFVEAKEAR